MILYLGIAALLVCCCFCLRDDGLLCKYFEQPTRFHIRKADAKSKSNKNSNKDRRREADQDNSITPSTNLNTTSMITMNLDENTIHFSGDEYETSDRKFYPHSYITKHNFQI